MRRGFVALLLSVGVVTAACGGDGAPRPRFETAGVRASTTTSSTTTTTAPPQVVPAPQPTAGLDGTTARAVRSPNGVVMAVVGRASGGVQVLTPCGNQAVLTTGTPITTPAVVLDPGHGGDEPGAVGANGLSEKALNLIVARETAAALERVGTSVVLTRTSDYRVTLGSRARIAKALSPRAFVSIHHNGGSDGPRDGPGSETFYQVASPTAAESKRLAGLIYEEIVRALSQYQVAWQADRDAGAKYRRNTSGDDYYGILRLTKGVTAVLAELAFLSNPPEAELLARSDVQKVEAEAVARGIARFLTTNDPGSGFTEPYPRTEPAGPGGGTKGCVDPPL